MPRVALYSNSSRSAPARRSSAPEEQRASEPSSVPRRTLTARMREFCGRHDKALLFSASIVCALAFVLVHASLTKVTPPLTQKDFDAAVLRTLESTTLPSAAAKAYDIVRPSVVRVRGLETDEHNNPLEKSVGTGVVITEKGTILTNFHVVSGASRVAVVFDDGTESDAKIVGAQPEHDLAVIQPQTIPDDLEPATLRSTSDLRVGDEVVAVGFPFGIGPSLSAGVVSGLRREYQSPEGERLLSNLIQFDAAVNPGNSGGPLVTVEGEVVGIVTAILNPSEQRVFIGIGFAVPIENAASAAGVSPF